MKRIIFCLALAAGLGITACNDKTPTPDGSIESSGSDSTMNAPDNTATGLDSTKMSTDTTGKDTANKKDKSNY